MNLYTLSLKSPYTPCNIESIDKQKTLECSRSPCAQILYSHLGLNAPDQAKISAKMMISWPSLLGKNIYIYL